MARAGQRALPRHHARVPFLLQIWMYASPIVYPLSVVPERWRALYCLNPMVGVIEGFRWALIGKSSPTMRAILGSVAVILVALVRRGSSSSKRQERAFAGPDIERRRDPRRTSSKRYRIGTGRSRRDSFRDILSQGVRSMFGRGERSSTADFWALQNASFEVRRGENVGIIGLNGAGKSTLLKLLSRITDPTTGRARLSGRVGVAARGRHRVSTAS